MSKRHTRRDVLRTTGAAGAAGITVSMAGCVGDPGEDDDTTDVEGAEELGDPVDELDFVVPTSGTNSTRNELAGIVAENWREIGFEVNVEELEFDPQVERTVINQDYDASVLGWGGTPERIDPSQFLMDMHHSDFSGEGENNTMGYDNPDYDELAEAQLAEADPDARQEIVFDAQELLAEEQPRTYVANEGGVQPYNSEDFTNVNPALGEGLNSFWNMIEIEPTSDDIDTVRMGYPAEIIAMNPLTDLATPDRQIIRLLFDTLYRIDPEGEPMAWMADEEATVDDDGTTYTIELRDDLTFHDGEDVTAEDVQYSYDLYRESPSFESRADIIDSIDAGDGEVTFHLDEPYAPFESNLLAQFYIFPEHIWGEVDDPVEDIEGEPGDEEYFVGSGPYQFDEWEREQELRFTAFDDHFNTPATENFVRIPGADGSQLIGDLEAGSLDFVGDEPEPAAVDRLEDDDEIDLAEYSDIGHLKIAYNHRREPFDMIPVRRAMSYCVEKETYVNDIRDGQGTVTHSPISEHVEAWHNPDVEEFHFDLDAARQELADAGFGWDDDGLLHYGADQ